MHVCVPKFGSKIDWPWVEKKKRKELIIYNETLKESDYTALSMKHILAMRKCDFGNFLRFG